MRLQLVLIRFSAFKKLPFTRDVWSISLFQDSHGSIDNLEINLRGQTRGAYRRKIAGINNVNFPKRDILTPSMELLGRWAWGDIDRGRPNRGARSCVIDNGFNGCYLSSFNWLRKYVGYSRDTNQRKIDATIRKSIRFVFKNLESMGSTNATHIPILDATEFKQVRVRLFTDDTELLLGLDLVSKLDLYVNFIRRDFQAGHREWKAAVSNTENRWVFPLSPTAPAIQNWGSISRQWEIAKLQF